MAQLAADHVAETMRALLIQKEEISIYFSGAESQQEFHRCLRKMPGVEWLRINAFAVDEFLDDKIPPTLAVSNQPKRDLYQHVSLKSTNVLDYSAMNGERE